LAGGGGEPHHHPVQAHRARERALIGKQGAHRSQHLRHQNRRRQPLGDARQHERRRGRRDAAQDRGAGERRHRDQEQPAATVEITKASAGDEKDRVGGSVAGDDQLHLGRRGV
jgi:hypothetical protein